MFPDRMFPARLFTNRLFPPGLLAVVIIATWVRADVLHVWAALEADLLQVGG